MIDIKQHLSNQYQMFNGSSNDITLQTLLWRYMTFAKFCWLLENHLLYHTRIDQFDDVFEGAVTDAYAKRRDSGEIEPHFSQKEFEPWIFKCNRFRQFATCWHVSQYESDALWKLYAVGEAGIAVVSTMERVQQSVVIPASSTGILGQVEYVDFETHDIIRDGGCTVIRPGFLKRRSFQHERKVRGIIMTNLIVDGGRFTMDEAFIAKQRDQQPPGIDAQVDLKGLLHSIVISPLAKPFVEKLVHIITKRHGLGHLVRKSDLIKSPVY
jgi:hypothetical protein